MAKTYEPPYMLPPIRPGRLYVRRYENKWYGRVRRIARKRKVHEAGCVACRQQPGFHYPNAYAFDEMARKLPVIGSLPPDYGDES